MASTSGGVAAEVASRGSSYHRTGSGASTRSYVSPEHLQTVQSGIVQTGWSADFKAQPTWVKRTDSTKAHYTGSLVGVGITRKLQRGLGFYEVRKADVWRAVAVELVATAGFTFLSIVVTRLESSIGARAFLLAAVYALIILAATPTSGGHLNPAITVATLLTGHATLMRAILYVAAQFCGGVLGGAAARFLTGSASAGACALPASLTNAKGLVAEIIFTSILLFVACGVGFDARSVAATFPIAAPFVIGGAFGVLVLISQGFGYVVTMNPARCLGPGMVGKAWDSLGVFVLGPVAAAALVGLFLLLVRQGNGDEFGPVLPLNFFQSVVPDDQRPGFGPRSPQPFYPTDLDVAHSQHHSQQHAVPHEALGSDPSKYSLTLQIKAFMQPKSGVSNTNTTSPLDQNAMLQQYSNSHGSSDIIVVRDPEKVR